MSHFTVLVIGNYPEDLLAPYSECDEDYFTEHDITEKVRADFERRKGIINGKKYDFLHFAEEWEGATVVNSESEHLKKRANKKSHIFVDKNGECKVFTYYNDYAKYDYYTDARDSASRWDLSNLIFKKKDFDPLNSEITIGDVDFDAMLAKIDEESGKEYDKALEIFGGSIPEYKTWTELLDSIKEKEEKLYAIYADDERSEEEKAEAQRQRKELLNGIRDFYLNQEPVELFNKKTHFWHGCALDDFYGKTREEYIKEGCLPFHSILTEDGWHERAKMGWWAVELDEKMSPSEWREYQLNLIKSIAEENPNTPFVLYDCHI